MGQSIGAGYLARVEANFVTVRAAPDAVFVRLRRTFAGEGQETSMFTEMTPVHALQLVRDLQEAVREALAHAEPAEAVVPR